MKNRSRNFLVSFLGVSLGALTARAATDTTSVSSARVSVSDHLIFSNSENQDDPTAARSNLFMHEANVRGEYQPYSLGVQFSNRYTADGDRSLNRPFNLEKKTAALESENWTVKLGDSYQELGRGIALSLYRDPVFGLENTLEGASVRYHPDGLDTSLFAGRVNALRAPVAIHPVDTSLTRNEFFLAGASVIGTVASDTKVGGHYLISTNRSLETKQFDKNFHTVGAIVQKDNLVEGVDTYVESNLLVTDTVSSAIPTRTGYGSYGSVVWSPTPWKAKMEVKDYRNYGFEFRRPPTLEEDIIESVNISDVSAARLYGEHRNPETRTTLFSSYLLGRDRLVNSVIHHGILGTKFLASSVVELELKAGYRTLPGKSNLTHGALKGKAKTFKGQAVELGLRKQYGNVALDLAPTVDDRNMVDVTYTFSESFNVGLGYEFIPHNDPSVGTQFFNAGATYKTGALVSRAFVGKTSGGTLCSGGVCRQVPPYTGALLETNYTF